MTPEHRREFEVFSESRWDDPPSGGHGGHRIKRITEPHQRKRSTDGRRTVLAAGA
jgi:hypothetical protein